MPNERPRLGIDLLRQNLDAIRKKTFGAPVDFDAIHREAARRRAAGKTRRAPKRPSRDPSGRTKIVNARKMFDREFLTALRSLGLNASFSPSRVWIGGEKARYFDLAMVKGLRAFRRFKADVLAQSKAT